MDDLLKPVKTVRNVKSNIEKFETLSLREKQAKNDTASTRKILAEVPNGPDRTLNVLKRPEEREESVNRNDHATKDLIRSEYGQSSNPDGESIQSNDPPISSPEQASEILKQQPTDEIFETVIRYLENGLQKKHSFNLHVPSAPAAQILNALVTNVIPDRWAILNSNTGPRTDKAIRNALLLCMSSTAGIGAVIARIQSLLASPQIRKAGSSHHVVFKDTVSFFGSMIYHKTFVRDLLFRSQSSGGKPGQQQAVWAEATSLLAGSKILNIFLEASAISELKSEIPSWLQNAKDYSGWLGVNIASAATSTAPSMEENWKLLANLLKRALSLGQKGRY